jgi:hypothetical protein
MKFLMAALLICLLGFAAGLYLPWWSIAVVAALVAIVLNLKPGPAFLAGLTGAFLLWGGMAFFINNANDSILAHRMSQFILKKDSPGLLMLVTAIIGALAGAMGGLTGSLTKQIRGTRS